MSRTAPTTRLPWEPGPIRPVITEHAVHVWRADLRTVSDDVAELLCGDESARAERFASADDAQRWRRARGLLRALLGRYLQREPGALRFATGEHGKPALLEHTTGSHAPTHRARQLSFNISHSADLALFAFSDAADVGVDVEVARRQIDEVAIAARILGAPEARRLQALDPPARQREFLRAWTRHEATLKCLGVGIGGARNANVERALCVVQLEMGRAAAGAVAATQAMRELRCWEWQA